MDNININRLTSNIIITSKTCLIEGVTSDPNYDKNNLSLLTTNITTATIGL